MSCPSTIHWKHQAIAILLFGMSFGYVEAAVVTYLRPQFDAARSTFGSSGRDVFPIMSSQQVKAAGPEVVRLLGTEIAREAATMLMLGAVAAAAAGDFRQWLACFLLAFGAWDIFYYVFLKVLIDWPKSLLTWDVLFLIPVPWSAPVLAPGLVAVTMIGTGLAYLWQESNGRSIRLRAVDWLAACLGAVLILAAFTWDCRNVMAGGMPKPFHWTLFALGEVLWVAAVLHALTAAAGHPSRIEPAV